MFGRRGHFCPVEALFYGKFGRVIDNPHKLLRIVNKNGIILELFKTLLITTFRDNSAKKVFGDP